jgi:hypothetical protein
MALGASLGAVGGLVVGVVQLLSDRKRRRAEWDVTTNRGTAEW